MLLTAITFTNVVFPEYCKPTRVSSISSFQNRLFIQSKILRKKANIFANETCRNTNVQIKSRLFCLHFCHVTQDGGYYPRKHCALGRPRGTGATFQSFTAKQFKNSTWSLAGLSYGVQTEAKMSAIEQLKSEVERLSNELQQACLEKVQAAEYGLAVLEEKQTLQEQYDELESVLEVNKQELECLKEVLNTKYFFLFFIKNTFQVVKR